MPARKRKDYSKTENPEARMLFETYENILMFMDMRDYNIRNLNEQLRKDLLRHAAAIIHNEAMMKEYPKNYYKDGTRRDQDD